MTGGRGGKQPCTKRPFPTLDAAEQALFDAKVRRFFNPRTRRREQRAYPCIECAAWHLTSKPARTPKEDPTA